MARRAGGLGYSARKNKDRKGALHATLKAQQRWEKR
jgi:hypothetical protein